MGRLSKGKIVVVLQHLAAHGWVSLRSMSILLGYSYPTGIYGRQKGKHAIPTISIGGIYRVYADVVIHELNNRPEQDQAAAKVLLSIYHAACKERENE